METVVATLYGLDILILISFQVLNRDYVLFPHAISVYGVGKTAHVFKIYVLCGSIAAPLLALQFWHAGTPSYPPSILVYLALVMMGRLGVGLFPVDLPGAAHTTSGQIHHAATLLAFACVYMTVVEATPLLAAGTAGPLTTALSGLKHLISFGFLGVVLTISLPLRRYFGLLERLFLYATALWFLTASLTLPPL